MSVRPDSIAALIDKRATQDGDRVALVDPTEGVCTDYRKLRQRVRSVAASLGERGVKAGDSVAFALYNGVDTATVVLGIQYCGARAVAINLIAGQDVIGYVLTHSEATLVVVEPATQELIESATQPLEAPPRRVQMSGLLRQNAGDAAFTDRVEPTAGDDALLMYTSGTTGRPKGVRLSHGNLLAGGDNAARGHGLGPQDRALCTLPLFHINGLCVTLYGPLMSAGSVVLPERFSASRFWGWASEHGCTWFSVVPTQIAYLLHANSATVPVPTLRFGRSASAPLSPDVHRAFEQRFGLPLIETMGLTETAAQITTNPMPPAKSRIGSAGQAFGCELRIAAAADGRPLPAGEEGEIQIRGDNVMQGYLRNDAATREALHEDGWLRTGDLGRLDEQGFVFVTGRLKELIIKGGENIAPREVDEALQAHPDVLEAAAFGVPCADYGERVEAAIVAVPGRTLDVAALLCACEARLGAFKRPDRLHLLDELPKGPSGKIQRRLCAALCQDAAADAPA